MTEYVDDTSGDQHRSTEAICRFLLWVADAPSMLDRGLRATIALNCLRPDLLACPTLAQIPDQAARRPQYAHRLAEEFRLLIGLPTNEQ